VLRAGADAEEGRKYLALVRLERISEREEGLNLGFRKRQDFPGRDKRVREEGERMPFLRPIYSDKKGAEKR